MPWFSLQQQHQKAFDIASEITDAQKKQIEQALHGLSFPGLVLVDSRGAGEISSEKLEAANIKAVRIYPPGCSEQAQ
jgi:hypothetical protein